MPFGALEPLLAIETVDDDTMTAILGISAFYHDAAAAIVVDGSYPNNYFTYNLFS